ncbi:MAG: zinc-binding alcohol dehydrogenase [Kiritimatiellia bacterium]
MKAHRIVWPTAQTAALETFDLPEEVPANHILIETDYTLISPGTERDGLLNRTNTRGAFPRYPGYSAVGRVLSVGEGVTDLTVGDRVVAYHSPHASHSVKKRRDVVRIDSDTLESEIAVFSIIAAMSLQGVRKLRPELGESVMVMGLGLLGLFATQFARLAGGLPVIALDFSEARRTLALSLGADHAFSPEEADLTATIKELTGNGVNAVAEITGAPAAVKQAFGFMAPMGRIALIGCSRTPTTEVDFYNDVHKPGVTIIGAHNFARPAGDSHPGYWTLQDDLKTLLRLFAAKRLHAAPLISEIVTPDAAPKVYQRLLGEPTNPPGILFDWRNTR